MSRVNELNRLIDCFSNLKILVFGDFLLDEFLFGEISRISREAPVLILKHRAIQTLPGGGANAVANVASLGAQAIPVGFLGDDPWAEILLSLWPKTVEKHYVFRDSAFHTTRKRRILAGSFHSFHQQVVRIDYEIPSVLQKHHQNKIMKSLSELIPQVDGIILSDYSLGNLDPNLWQCARELAHSNNKPIVVDSRDQPSAYPGATSITPNITEIEAFLEKKIGSDLTGLEEVGRQLRRDWQLDALLVTRGKLGMSLFEKGRITHLPVFGSDEVADVTGAGDTVIAAYTMALAAGSSFEQAARLANCAAGTVVMKRGTATLSESELRRVLTSDEEIG